MLVPYGAGGATDTTGRIVAEGMRGPLGQPVIIENVVGASGTIGVGRVARTVPDGYTFVLGGFATHVLNGPMFALHYDLIRDFEAVSLISSEPLMIVARKTMPANNLQEFIAWLKANPDQAAQGTTGAGGVSTVGGLFFKKNGHAVQVCALSGRPWSGHAGHGSRPNRLHDRLSNQFAAAVTRRCHKGICGYVEKSIGSSTRCPNGRRSRFAWVLRFELAGDVFAQRRTQERNRQAECRRRGCLGRSDGAPAARRIWAGNPATQSADAGNAQRPFRKPKSRSGGRSSRRQTSRASELKSHDIP